MQPCSDHLQYYLAINFAVFKISTLFMGNSTAWRISGITLLNGLFVTLRSQAQSMDDGHVPGGFFLPAIYYIQCITVDPSLRPPVSRDHTP